VAWGITDYYKYAAAFGIGCIFGGIAVYFMLPARIVPGPAQERVVEKHIPVVQEVVRHTATTEIGYVPKEQIMVRQADGSMAGQREQADVDVQTAKPAVTIRVNGREYESRLLQSETQKFELGKVSLRQDSQIAVDLQIKPHVIDNTKSGGIDVFFGRYSGVTLKHRRIGIDIGTNGRETDVRLRWAAIQW
jgi:hypothetical protein